MAASRFVETIRSRSGRILFELGDRALVRVAELVGGRVVVVVVHGILDLLCITAVVTVVYVADSSITLTELDQDTPCTFHTVEYHGLESVLTGASRPEHWFRPVVLKGDCDLGRSAV